MDKKEKEFFTKYLDLILAKLYELHFEQLYKSAIGYVRDKQEANDIVNDSFWALSKELSKTLNPSKFANWLASYTEERCCTFLRRVERPIEINISTPNSRRYSRQYYKVTDEDWYLIVQNVVDRLPAQRRKIIKYFYWDGLASDEIAVKMGLSRQTILNQKNRALHWLKSEIRNEASKY